MNRLSLTCICVALVSISSAMAAPDFMGNMIRSMDEAQKSHDEKARRETLALMPLEAMFPDPQVRALADAAGRGDITKVEKLVTAGVNVNSRGARDATPLFWAMHNLDGFKKLLELGADPNIVFGDGSSVMFWSIHAQNNEFLKEALRHGGNPNLRTGPLQETLLFEAMGPDGKGKVDLLLDAGADINAQSLLGDTPVMVAAKLRQFDVVLKLLNCGADYTVVNKNGKDLAKWIALVKKRVDPANELTRYMEKVIAWLAAKGVRIPD